MISSLSQQREKLSENGRCELPATAMVVRRPHFRCVGRQLYFLASKRPLVELSPEEEALWLSLDKEPPVEELRSHQPSADKTIHRFIDLGLCEILEEEYPTNRRRVLVFEPHSDDAVLSVGGAMWLRRRKCEFNVVTIGSRSNFTSYYYLDRPYFDVDEVSTLRRAEGALFTRLLGGHYRVLDLPEASLRYQDGNWSLDWYRRHRLSVGAFISHHSGAEELHQWTEAIRNVLSQDSAEEVWFPLGGAHTDHQLTRDACLRLMCEKSGLFQNREVRFYQDVPYAARFPEFTPNVVRALTQEGAKLHPEEVDITSVFNQKRHLISVYGSQFKLDAIWPDVERSARQGAPEGRLAERFWLIEQAPEKARSSSVRIDRPVIHSAAERLRPWIARHGNAARIRMLLLVPAGRWRDDMGYLLQAFPKARFEVYVATFAETSQLESSRIRVFDVGGGAKAWLSLAFRLMTSRPRPTVFVAGERRLREAKVVSAFWPLCDPVVLPAMDHLVSALQELAAQSTASSRASTA